MGLDTILSCNWRQEVNKYISTKQTIEDIASKFWELLFCVSPNDCAKYVCVIMVAMEKMLKTNVLFFLIFSKCCHRGYPNSNNLNSINNSYIFMQFGQIEKAHYVLSGEVVISKCPKCAKRLISWWRVTNVTTIKLM